MVCGSINQNPEKREEAGPPHHPVIHGELPSGPQQTQSQNDLRRRHQLWQMTKEMRRWPKRPRNLPWSPKSTPAGIRNDERQAGHFLYPLVTVDFVTKVVHDSTS